MLLVALLCVPALRLKHLGVLSETLLGCEVGVLPCVSFIFSEFLKGGVFLGVTVWCWKCSPSLRKLPARQMSFVTRRVNMSVAWHAEGTRVGTPKAVAGGAVALEGFCGLHPHGQTAAVHSQWETETTYSTGLPALTGECLVFLAACILYTGVASSKYIAFPKRCPIGSSAQNGSALKREFSGGSYNTKRQPMPSPSEGSLSSGGMDQGSDAPARDYDGEVNGPWVAAACLRPVPCPG